MELLADESCDFAIVRALRAAGHEVVAVAEILPRAADNVILALATNSAKILPTEDKDFGQLVYSSQQPTGGVIFIRFPPVARRILPPLVVTLVKERGGDLAGRFVVLQPGKIRLSRSRCP